MIDPRSPDFKPVIETEEATPKEWTPVRGLRNGLVGCLIAGSLMGAAWIGLTLKIPNVAIFHIPENASVKAAVGFFFGGVVIGFVMTWVLFVCMHRVSRMIGWQCTLGVVAVVLLIIVARQMVMAITGVRVDGLDVTGWAWLAPRRFVICNASICVGLAGATYLFREGESWVDMFYG